jgi:hypothetical protein
MAHRNDDSAVTVMPNADGVFRREDVAKATGGATACMSARIVLRKTLGPGYILKDDP